MPSLFKKLVIIAAVDGLLVCSPSPNRRGPDLHIRYKTCEISSLPHSPILSSRNQLNVHGIVGTTHMFSANSALANNSKNQGLLTFAPVSYLVAILHREQVAQIRGSPVHVITDVALVPLSSQSDANKAVDRAKESLNIDRRSTSPGDNETSDDGEVHTDDEKFEGHNQASSAASVSSTSIEAPGSCPGIAGTRTSHVAENVISRKGQYGRFAERWFYKNSWSTAPLADRPAPKDSARTSTIEDSQQQARQSPTSHTTSESIVNNLLPKLLRTTRMLLTSRSFFFSYDIDITRRLGSQGTKLSDLPLHKCVDPLVSALSVPSLHGSFED